MIPLRRIRPLLGTYVRIDLVAERMEHGEQAMDAAFRRIEAIHVAMSFHQANSELSRLNRLAHRQAQSVGTDTLRVLEHALVLAEASDGLFDPCVGSSLVACGLLPSSDAPPAAPDGNWRHIHLLDGMRVAFSRPLWLDLGGIAKGDAVDQAIEELVRLGIDRATVNAGGDLRVHCTDDSAPEEPLFLRAPGDPDQLIPIGGLRNGALATSGEFAFGRPDAGPALSPLVDPHAGIRPARARSVSVLGNRCWLADGLTKIVALQGDASQALLDRMDCCAAIIETDGQLHASPGFLESFTSPRTREPAHA